LDLLPDGFVQADYCNTNCTAQKYVKKSIESIKSLINQNTCAVLVEPIQGEGGIITPQDGWLSS
jgi:acetylornithine/succinyldiaminopimelate/putrescine aminotransferase